MPLQHGPWIAALAVFAVAPGGLWLLALLLERRLMDFRTGLVAMLLGEPLLALAVAPGGVGWVRRRQEDWQGRGGD
ncbi:hypothetical protein ACFU8W_34785 [Streptomyces sp. NPDC057565]|uniref:hypothetical protein n=1 Tax=Streptomyces sp. NPDC057565 TaxID=3346169 RepID=UPI00368256EC